MTLYFTFRNGRYHASAPPPKRTRPRSPREEARAVLTEGVRFGIIKAADRTCNYCQRQGDWLRGPDGAWWTLDHVVPLERGGAPGRDNVVLSCMACNREKGRRTPEEWRASA